MRFQQTLTDMFNEMSKHGRKRTGMLGEAIAAKMLERGGYDVTFTEEGTFCGDLRVVDKQTGQVTKVECKTARRAVDGKWRFTLTSTGTGRTDYRHSDVVVLIAVHDVTGTVTPFVIPVDQLGDRCQVCISSQPDRYAGRWADYRQSPHRGLTL